MCEVCSRLGRDKWLHAAIIKPCGLGDTRATNVEVECCPMCGRQLSEPKPLTLAELRERDGEPVWDDRRKEWGIIDGDAVQHCGNHSDYIIDEGGARPYFYDRPPTRQEGGETIEVDKRTTGMIKNPTDMWMDDIRGTNCPRCSLRNECWEGNWAISVDTDGVNCDIFLLRGSRQEGGESDAS